MLTGKQFRLIQETLGVESVGDGKRVAIIIPENALLLVLRGPNSADPSMVHVEWDGRRLELFAQDLQARGQAVVA